MRQDRRLLLSAAAAAALCLTLGLLGQGEPLLHFAPLAVLASLLLKGCYVGEARMVALRERAQPLRPARRRPSQRWRPGAERAPRPLLLRLVRGVRGPPAGARAAAV